MSRSLKRLLSVMLFIASFFAYCNGMRGFTLETAQEKEIITDFRDIPGITPEDIIEVEQIISSRDMFYCPVVLGLVCFYDETQQIKGFSVSVFEWLSDVFDIPFTPMITQWEDLLSGIEAQIYDFSIDIPNSMQDDGKFFMTDTIVECGKTTSGDCAVSFVTCNPQLKPMIDVIQKCLLADAGNYLNQLYEEAYYLDANLRLFKELTAEEKDFLLEYQSAEFVINVGVNADNYPYSFFNAARSEWQGIAIDVLKEMGKITGMHFSFRKDHETQWPTMISMLESGVLSMTSELVRSPERAGKYLWTTAPYVTDNYTFVSMAEDPAVSISRIPSLSIGLISDSTYADVFHEMYPHHTNFHNYNNEPDALDALAKGEVDLVMMTRNALLKTNNYLGKVGYRANIILQRANESYFGFSKKEAVLCSIINKTQKMIDLKQISDLWARKPFDYREKLMRVQIPYMVLIILLFLCIAALFAMLMRKNNKMNKLLEASVYEKMMALQEQSRMSYTDKLTNIYNRLKIDEELARCCGEEEPFFVLMIDIDFFKRINDTYGHLIGDQVLVEVTSVILKNIRSNDVFARWGGEEFVIVHQSKGRVTDAEELAKRLTREIAEREFSTIGHITISIGVTNYMPGDTPNTLMNRVDEALYQSKENGRNCVTAL